MILGIGTDIVEIGRIRRLCEKSGTAFFETVLSAEEIAQMQQRNGNAHAEYVAGRWAAKEALGKALGTGLGGSCSPSEVTVRNNGSGAPEIFVTGHTAEVLASKKV